MTTMTTIGLLLTLSVWGAFGQVTTLSPRQCLSDFTVQEPDCAAEAESAFGNFGVSFSVRACMLYSKTIVMSESEDFRLFFSHNYF